MQQKECQAFCEGRILIIHTYLIFLNQSTISRTLLWLVLCEADTDLRSGEIRLPNLHVALSVR